MVYLPRFITFTGVDDKTDINEMTRLTAEYPIEWGVLFSVSRQGVDPRYPCYRRLEALTRRPFILAAHLCGAYADAVNVDIDVDLPVSLRDFTRVQINHAVPNPSMINSFARRHGFSPMQFVAQCRDDCFPENDGISWLNDASGGRGLSPTKWPEYPGRLVGYAGGLGPHNVRQEIEAIDADGPYWIDMESGVRTNNVFDLAKCRAVCEEVYGR